MSAGIAVIGLACRFPGARDVGEFWANLEAGVESIEALSDEDLVAAGVDGATRARPDYVAAAPVLADAGRFDARFFGYSPREAKLLDPQQRVFLESAWAALEHSGYDMSRYDGKVGVYAGSAMNTYLVFSGAAERLRDDYLMTLIASDKDFLTSRVSYKLDLTGPSVVVQSACSTSLVAVHIACQALLGGECDMALAGGVSVRVPERSGYVYEPGGVLSPDGHCRSFDAEASGTLFGSGVGVVVLKPLADALADGDCVHAVIRGSAVNNDGSAKVEYEAPSVGRQAEVIVEALAHAGVAADTIGYVEAHGTATALGDPVEVEALTKAFRTQTTRTGFCAIGSVKSNVGHLDAAAGVAGLIKTILALEHRRIPASLHFQRPNPAIKFESTPFVVNARLAEWPAAAHPRRAGVSSLGIGGTNAHVILEEGPALAPAGSSRSHELFVLSARSRTALDAVTRNMSRHLAGTDVQSLADVAYTLQVGRRSFPHRRVVVGAACDEVARALLDGTRPATARAPAGEPQVAFVFPGGGAQHAGMAEDLRATEPVFRDSYERGLDALLELGLDLRRPLDDVELRRPSTQLPAIFLVEEALARLWMSWGIKPTALAGYSMGEITAAHLAGVLEFDDALRLVLARGRLAEAASGGGMLSVRMPAGDLAGMLDAGLDIASVDTPGTCVVAGPAALVDALAATLVSRGIESQAVPIAAAGHSRLLDPLLAEWADHVRAVHLAPPSIPFLSNLTGTWITAEQAVDPDYWVRQLRCTVRFADMVGTLLREDGRVVLEVGPGRTLSSLVRRHPAVRRDQLAIASLRHPLEQRSDVESVLTALGRLWLAGVAPDWEAVHSEPRRRVPLPTYPFEGEHHWLDDRRGAGAAHRPVVATAAVDEGDEPGDAPRTPVERQLAAIWREVLGVSHVGVHDDFFELGGSSLLVTRAVARVNEVIGVELSVMNLLESPTIAQFARCVAAVEPTVL